MELRWILPAGRYVCLICAKIMIKSSDFVVVHMSDMCQNNDEFLQFSTNPPLSQYLEPSGVTPGNLGFERSDTRSGRARKGLFYDLPPITLEDFEPEAAQ